MEGIDVLRAMADELASGRGLVECVVLRARGSVPRGAGARMVALADGRFLGTVGGGAAELMCQREARAMLATAGLSVGEGPGDEDDAAAAPARGVAGPSATVLTLDHGRTGMVCGGVQEVGLRVVDPVELGVVRAAIEHAEAGEPAWLSVDWVAASPRFELVSAPESNVAGPLVYRDGRSWEAVRANPRVVIFGAGHVGSALARLLPALDLDVLVLDTRAELLKPLAVEGVRTLPIARYEGAVDAAGVGARDLVVVMSATHGDDLTLVHDALAAGPRYLGCMGSRGKRAFILSKLGEEGVAEEELANVEIPVGLPIGAKTPAEIALSVAARLIQVVREDG